MGMIKNVLLTGGTGFIGSHLIEHLLKEKINIILLKRSMSDTWRIKHLLKDIKTYNIDNVLIEEIFKENKLEAIIHLATYYKKYHGISDIENMIYSNITFPTKLLDMCLKYKVKYFINTGTFFEYNIKSLPVNENEEKKPFNLYSATKISFEDIAKFYSDQVKIITLRIFSPYGEKDNEYKLIPTLIKKAILNEEIELSEGFQKLDFIYVKDIANAYVKVLQNIEKLNTLESFNIGSGFPYSIREIVSIVEEILEKTVKVKWGKPSKDIQICYADISKVKNYIGWEPKFSLKEGLERTISYYKEVINENN
ncbi:NAD-dependent epimerase/dehydratase family protein [Persephonella hydrogeniphila]|nr:NAD(P)-dependent oxidoreductase [Persephonella hydrogeniphila]